MKQPLHIRLTAWFIALVVILTLLTVVLPAVRAQESTPEPTPVVILPPSGDLPAAPTTPSELIAVYTLFAGSVLTTLIVELLAKFLPNVAVETLKQWTAVGLTGVFTVLVFSGNVSWFATGSTWLQNALPFITGLIGTLFGPVVTRRAADKVGIQLAR